MNIPLEQSWKMKLEEEFKKPYFTDLTSFVQSEYITQTIYPSNEDVFRAFNMCPFEKVRVVILGQDPYHGEGQANGLCFAVHQGIKLPPSLKNIFKEITSDLGIQPEPSGDLSRWAQQGVLLLNVTLTVRKQTPGSHQDKGWEQFTDAVIHKLSDTKEHIVFILWGNYAKEKGKIIDAEKHLVLTSAHPSPFSAYNGFLGNKHFSKTNEYLKKQGLDIINWK